MSKLKKGDLAKLRYQYFPKLVDEHGALWIVYHVGTHAYWIRSIATGFRQAVGIAALEKPDG